MNAQEEQWWVINGAELASALHRSASGEDPELLYLELYANSERGQVDD